MAVERDKVDGIQSFVGGMNQSLPASIIKEDSTYKNINVDLLNGSLSPRPNIIELNLTVLRANERPAVGSLSYKENLYRGRIQHSGRFKTSLAEFIILIVNGVIYAFNSGTNEVIPLINQSKPSFLNYKAVRIEGGQAYNYYVIYDWPNRPVIIDNQLKVRRATSLDVELPVSYLGAFVHNRLFIANKGIEFGASDPVRPDAPNAPLTFLDSIVTPSNPSPAFPEQFFSLSFIERLSSITAMGHFESSGGRSTIGYGPLFISTKEAIFTFPINAPRSQWAEGVFGTVLVNNIGVVGPRAFTVVGSDIWYRSLDGHIYTVSTVASDQQKWGVSNISREIEDSLITRNKHLLRYSSMIYHNNKILVHLQPYATKSRNIMNHPIDDYVFNGVGVVQLNSISGITNSAGPVWSSLYPIVSTSFVRVDNKVIIIGKTKYNDEINSFYVLDSSSSHDVYGDIPTPIKSRIYTRELDLQSPLQDKKLTYVKLDIKNIVGDLKIVIRAKIGEEWEVLGEMLAKCVTHIDNELIPIREAFTVKTTQLRIDLTGYSYDFIRAFLVGELNTELKPEHLLEVDESCVNEKYVEDMKL